MVDMKISELATGTTLDGTEEFVMVQAAGNAKLAARDIAAVGAYSQLAKVSILAAQSLTGLIANTLAFDVEDYDIGGFYSGAQNTRLTVPAGVTLVTIQGFLQFTGASLATFTGSFGTIVHKNSSDVVLSNLRLFNIPSTIGRWNTEPIPVSDGDYFEIEVTPQTAGSFPLVLDGRCFFAINAIGFTPLPAPAPTTPTRRGVVAGGFANGNTGPVTTINLPIAPNVDDLILVYSVCSRALGSSGVVTAGYTPLYNLWNNNNAAAGMAYKVSDGTETSVELVDQPIEPVAYIIEVWAGVDTVDPFDGNTFVESTASDVPSITSNTDNAVSVVAGFNEGVSASGSVVALAGYSGLATDDTDGVGGIGSPSTIAANSMSLPTAGANDPGVWAWLSGTYRVIQFLLKPSG